jgi:hypothetical protein
MPETIPGFVHVSCRQCRGGGTVWQEGISLLESVVAGVPQRAGQEVDCPQCRGRGWDRTVYVGEPALPMQV